METSWEEMQDKYISWGENGAEVYCFESPRMIQKDGMESERALKTIEKMHDILGGRLSLPHQKKILIYSIYLNKKKSIIF